MFATASQPIGKYYNFGLQRLQFEKIWFDANANPSVALMSHTAHVLAFTSPWSCDHGGQGKMANELTGLGRTVVESMGWLCPEFLLILMS